MIDALSNIFGCHPTVPLLFNSETFWLLMILFLPLYGLLMKRKKAMSLFVLAFSLLFYYRSSGWLLAVLAGRTAVDYALSVLLAKSVRRVVRRTVLTAALLLSVGTLAYFKYADFVVLNLNALLDSNFRLTEMVVPLGISFYTFRSVSYLVEIYRRTVAVPSAMTDYLLYLSFFPALIAGPIVRPGEFFRQLGEPETAGRDAVYSGFWQVMKGLLKKAVIADYIAQYNNLVFANVQGYSGLEYLLGVFGYGVQIYFDFSGYSDMAIGIARVLGFDLGENFRSPYKARNIADFWRRWHISLSGWLRDYVYIPLGGNRKGTLRCSVNLMVTMLVGGVWHGAGWNFLIWGGLHGVALTIYKLLGIRVPSFRNKRLNDFIYGSLTFLFVNFLWIFFRAPDVGGALSVIRQIFTATDFSLIGAFWAERTLWTVMLAVAMLLIFLPDKVSAYAERRFVAAGWFAKFCLFCLLVQCILEFSGENVSPFIYAAF